MGFQKFAKLVEAEEAADACEEYVFAKEIFKTNRLFLVTTKEYFWSFYANLPVNEKKYYEVLCPSRISSLSSTCPVI